MATRAIVPREDGEGSLGIETKRWGDIQTNKLNDISMPTKPSISDAGKVLKLNDDATEYEYSAVTFPNINIEDEGKVLQIISGSPTWVQIIKPRADGEGSLGLEEQQWGDVQTKKINGIVIAEDGAATTSTAGVVELATSAEAIEGTATDRAVTPAVSGSRLTYAVTSTNDATSTTSAPLKTAGGLAVAKSMYVGLEQCVGGSVYGTKYYEIANNSATTVTITTPARSMCRVQISVLLNNVYSDGNNDCYVDAVWSNLSADRTVLTEIFSYNKTNSIRGNVSVNKSSSNLVITKESGSNTTSFMSIYIVYTLTGFGGTAGSVSFAIS